jgi:hypothetical protein
MTTFRSAEANSIAAPTITNPGVLSEMKARQTAKIRELGQALIDAGVRTLDAQADALGLARSTAWTILKTCHKASGLSAAIIERMLGSSKLPAPAHAVIVEYVEEKSFVCMVAAGDNNSDLPFACPRLSQDRRAPRRSNGEAMKKCPGYLRPRPQRMELRLR